MTRRALGAEPQSAASRGSHGFAMLLCVACTTTLDPTLTGAGGGAGAATGGSAGTASGAASSGTAGTEAMPLEVEPKPINECAVLSGTDHEYRACERVRSFDEASVDCKSGGGVLIKVDAASETDLLKTVMLPGKQWGWLGARRNSAFDWSWLDGTPFWHGAADGTAEPGAYINWQSGEPDNSSETVRDEEACATFDIASSAWVDRYCGLLLPYVCELPPGVSAGAP